MTRTGRPPLPAEERRRIIGINMSPAAIEALRELALLRGESQGMVIDRLVIAALSRERKKINNEVS